MDRGVCAGWGLVLGGRGPRQRIALAINIGQLLSSVPGVPGRREPRHLGPALQRWPWCCLREAARRTWTHGMRGRQEGCSLGIKGAPPASSWVLGAQEGLLGPSSSEGGPAPDDCLVEEAARFHTTRRASISCPAPLLCSWTNCLTSLVLSILVCAIGELSPPEPSRTFVKGEEAAFHLYPHSSRSFQTLPHLTSSLRGSPSYPAFSQMMKSRFKCPEG